MARSSHAFSKQALWIVANVGVSGEWVISMLIVVCITRTNNTMTVSAQTVDNDEVEKFSRIAEEWWDERGKFRPLHRINPLRLRYIRDMACAHWGRNPETETPSPG